MEINKRCKWCGSPFIAQKVSTQFCSHRCANASYKKKKRNAKLEKSLEEDAQLHPLELKGTMDKPYLSPLEVANYFGVSKATIYRYLANGLIKSLQLRRSTLIRKADIDALFDLAPVYKKRSYRKRENTSYYTIKEIIEKYKISKKAILRRCDKLSIPKMSEWCQQWQSAANALATYLYSLAPHEQVDAMLARYRTGSTHDGRVIYWQIDQHGRVRTGKFMRYGPDGHRVKGQAGALNWVHAVKGLEQLADQCLFGEHLLMEHTGHVALVESEKTALILALKRPDIVWIATAGKKGFMHERLWPLCGRKVYVLPDADALDEWTQRVEELNREHGYQFIVPDEYRGMCTLEARERKWDLADMLLMENC